MRHAAFPRMVRMLPLVIAALMPVAAAAQNTAESAPSNSQDTSSVPVPSWGKSIIDSFSAPVHPIIGGVVSGGGIGFGVGYDSPVDTGWYRHGLALMTVRRYWALEGEIGRRSASNRSAIAVFGNMRHMNRIDFFGIGPGTPFDDRSAFRLRDATFGTSGWYRMHPALRAGGTISAYLPDIGSGANRALPSIEERFSESSVPGGLFSEPVFGRYRGFAELTYPVIKNPDASDTADVYQGTYQVTTELVRDHSTGRHDFHRWETEVLQRIPGVRSGQRLTLHGLVASTNTNANVPYYMLYTLGGSGGLKAFRPDLLGTDGTQATLRGYRNYRFRDRDLLLMQAEYRIPLHRHVHSTVFVDSGQVAPQVAGLFRDIKTTTGFSLSYMNKGKTLGRMDVGFGGEGVQIFWSFGAF